MEKSERIGGRDVVVQVDESKFGKRKYNRGHRVKGQWVFGGIEETSRKCFLVPVERRNSATLIPIIEKWILPGTTIISDYWKAYDVLSRKDFVHLKVNHSIEFKNQDGDHANKIEGHCRHAKLSLLSFGCRKDMYSSYLAEFMWRYVNKEKDLFLEFVKVLKYVYNVKG